MRVEIIEVKTKKQLNRFIRFPQDLYKDDKNYVSELNLSVKWMLCKKNPFLQHSEIALFLAKLDNKIVGRIAVIYNQSHLNHHKDNTGFFGFYDSINSVDVARTLFKTASGWLKNKGLVKMLGPTNLTTNDSCGFLLEGFEYPAYVQMPYNYQYYNDLCEKCGFQNTMDLYAYAFDGKVVVEKYKNIYNRALLKMKEKGISIRPVSSKYFEEDIAKFRFVYNKTNENNWGFIPFNETEVLAMAKQLREVTPLDFALLVVKDNQVIGYILAAPDINQALIHIKNGKLFPLGFLKFLWFKRKIDKARVMILGVLNEYSKLGIGLVLYHKITEQLKKHGIYEGEASYVMESNVMKNVLKKIGGKQYKKYRMYSKDIIDVF